MMLGRFFRDPDKGLRELISSFDGVVPKEQIDDFIDYIYHGEAGLALEILSDWIYEHDVPVSQDQGSEFIRLSDKYVIEVEYHAFIGRDPPYPDLRSPKQLSQGTLPTDVSMASVRQLLRSNNRVRAIRMYRQLTGATLEEACCAMEQLD